MEERTTWTFWVKFNCFIHMLILNLLRSDIIDLFLRVFLFLVFEVEIIVVHLFLNINLFYLIVFTSIVKFKKICTHRHQVINTWMRCTIQKYSIKLLYRQSCRSFSISLLSIRFFRVFYLRIVLFDLIFCNYLFISCKTATNMFELCFEINK